MAEEQTPNWARVGKEWFDLDVMPGKGPVLFCDHTQMIVWFSPDRDTDPVEHREHKRDDDGFVHDKGEPVIEARRIKPAFWSPVKVLD